MNLTPAQWLAVGIGILSVFTASAAQLTDLFGPTVAKDIASLASLIAGCLTVPLTVLTGQGSQAQATNDMGGVDKIVVNKNASATLAKMAMDPNSKVEAAPGAEAAIQAKAQQ